MAKVSFYLTDWSITQRTPRGSILIGNALVRLRRDPPTFVGVDVAYIAAEARPEQPRKARFIDGPPILVVEVLSPSDTIEDINDKVDESLDAGVPIVWVVEPRHSTVTVDQPNAQPRLFNSDQELNAEPFLPGFRVNVGDLFEDLV